MCKTVEDVQYCGGKPKALFIIFSQCWISSTVMKEKMNRWDKSITMSQKDKSVLEIHRLPCSGRNGLARVCRSFNTLNSTELPKIMLENHLKFCISATLGASV